MSYASSVRRRAVVPFALALLLALTLLPSVMPAGDQVDAATAEVFTRKLVTVDIPHPDRKVDLQEVRVEIVRDGVTRQVGLDITEHAGHDYVEVVLHSAADRDALRAANFTWDVRIADLDARAERNMQKDLAYAASVERSPLPSGRTSYRTMDDYNADMRRLAKNHPKIVKRFALKNRSVEGRPIWALEIGQGVRGPRNGRPVFAMMGLHHAREWPSGENTMEFAFDLIKNYGKNDRITRLLRRARVLIVPVVNVDGFRQSINDGLVDLREADGGGLVSILGSPSNAYKRKNCRIVDGQEQGPGPCAAAKSPGGFGVGVDLNRNYAAFWGGPGASPDKEDPTYRGPKRFSEPETRAVRHLIRHRHVTTLITNHTFSNLVLRPNGVNPQTEGPDGLPIGSAADEEAMRRLGKRMVANNGYTNQHGWELYDTTGTTEDWSYNATGGYGYTFEIGKDEFHPPYQRMMGEYLGRGEHKGKGNRAAFLVALENTVNTDHHSVITGTAPRGATLRMVRNGATPTWKGFYRDRVSVSMRVPRSGDYTWHTNPSTRPVVARRPYEKLGKAMRQQVDTGTTAPLGHTDKFYDVGRDTDVLDIRLDWPTPDDLDLEVSRLSTDGKTYQPVASSAGFIGEKERVLIQRPRAGQRYRMRVINFASASPTWTLTSSLHNTTTEYKPRVFEVWTMRCERNGRIQQTKQVSVNRGQRVEVNFRDCK